VIDFLIIAFCIFLLVKFVNKLTQKKKEEPAAPEISSTDKLLIEIRDELKKKS
jgi:large conductance mechanosensitive channel